MGLDMYLTKKTYIGANYKHRNVEGHISITINGEPVNIDFSKVSSITENVGYWRKANQIHKWFVDNVQEGEDNCEEYWVPFEKITELKELCHKVLETKDVTLLSPQSGFFFGSTEVDNYYFEDLKETIKILESLEPNGDYYYQSSW